MRLYNELKKHESCTGRELFKKTKNKYFETVEKIVYFKNINFMEIENIRIILEMLENKKETEIDEELNFIFHELQLNDNKALYNDVKKI